MYVNSLTSAVTHKFRRFKKFLLPDLGQFGETQAAKYLENNGYLVIDRNWSVDTGELDLVALKKRILIFIEVKSRNYMIADSFVPEEAVDTKKEEKIRRLSQIYRSQNRKRLVPCRLMDYRHDIITITAIKNLRWKKIELTHYMNVF